MITYNILFIEDIEQFHKLISAFIKTHNSELEVNYDFRLFKALNFEQGLRVLEKEKIDLILLDLLLPDISTENLLHTIKNKNYQIPIIVITGLNNTAEIDSYLIDLGIYRIIDKTEIAKINLAKEIIEVIQTRNNLIQSYNKLDKIMKNTEANIMKLASFIKRLK